VPDIANYLDAGSDDNSFGTGAWTNPGNLVGGNDDVYATYAFAGGENTHYLKGLNSTGALWSDLPDGCTITGIMVLIERHCASAVTDVRVRLVKGGVIQSTDKASATPWNIATDTVGVYGADGDLWGGSWTKADFASTGFGVVMSATAAAPDTASVDNYAVRVYYLDPSPQPPPRPAIVRRPDVPSDPLFAE